MTFVYKTKVMQIGDRIVPAEGDLVVGATIGPDSKGGFCLTVHMLVREEPPLPGQLAYGGPVDRAN